MVIMMAKLIECGRQTSMHFYSHVNMSNVAIEQTVIADWCSHAEMTLKFVTLFFESCYGMAWQINVVSVVCDIKSYTATIWWLEFQTLSTTYVSFERVIHNSSTHWSLYAASEIGNSLVVIASSRHNEEYILAPPNRQLSSGNKNKTFFESERHFAKRSSHA